MINNTISHFRILAKLDEGGMGVIYLAEDKYLNRRVVLKQLPAHMAKNSDLISRFKQEARAAAALKHPNIVTVYELFEHDGRLFIAMEYIDGVNLLEFTEEKAITIKQALVIVIQICRGLRKAHSDGVIHRDIKPANIMVDKEGWVKILDFGLAKLRENASITRLGSRMGTAPYSSPEQLRGEELKPGADIFSLGVILYELIAQQRPFKGKTDEEFIYAILQKKPIPLTKHNSEVTARLQKIVSKTLSKDSKRRYQNIEGFLHDLKKEKKFYAKYEKSKTRPVVKKPRVRNISLHLRDIESSVYRLGVASFRSCLIQLKQVRCKLFGKKAVAALTVLALVVAVCSIIYTQKDFFNRFINESTKSVEPIKTLLKQKSIPAFLQAFDEFQRLNLIASGGHVNFARADNCYLFVFDSQDVADVFKLKNGHLYSLQSQKTMKKPPHELAGKRKVWVQDLTAENRQTKVAEKTQSR